MTVLCKLANGEKIWPPPIWLMRQAGRYLPEYNVVRNKAGSFLDLCYKPEYASEVTLQPIERFDLDAAIIFADILLIAQNFGIKLRFLEEIGPVLEKSLLDSPKLGEVTQVEGSKLMNIGDAINLTRARLPKEKSLIGFCGAPWTVMTYIINGGSKKDFSQAIKWMEVNSSLASEMIDILVELSASYLILQISAGADVVKIFDSWAGLISPEDLPNYCYIPNLKIVNFCKEKKIPVMCFPKGLNKNYKEFNNIVKPDAISLDYDIDPAWAKQNLTDVVLQGGLDPKLLLSSEKEIFEGAKKYLDIFKDLPYIFNLGHGLLPETDPDKVSKLIKFYREY